METLIASSLYESLDAADQSALDAHLAACAACRAEHAELQAMVGAMPTGRAVFEGDLLPAIREELRRGTPPGWLNGWMRYLAGSFVALGVGLSVFVVLGDNKSPERVVVAPSKFEATLAEARSLVAADNPTGALAVLEEALATPMDAISTGTLRLEVANLEYDAFRRYEAAYEAYRVVFEGYAEAWAQSPGRVKERYDVLLEAREANFEPLYQIDAAVKQGESGLPALEQVMARYPGRGLAQAALDTMVAMSEIDGLGALEDVRSRCSNPVAVAQLDVRLGEGYCADNVNPEKGRALLHAVAESPYEVPARMAKDVLARLETGE
jgi:hypothetical protein